MLNLESELLKKTFNHDLKEFTRKGAGYFINSIHKDVNESVVPMIRMTINIVSMIVSEVALLLAMFFISWRASLVLFIIIPPLMYFSNIISQKVRKKTSLEREKEGIYTSFLTSALKAFKVMRTFNRIFDLAILKHRKTLEEYLDSSFESFKAVKSSQMLGDVIRNTADTLSLIVSGYFVLIGKLSFGGFVAIINTFWRAVSSLFGIVQAIPELHRYSQILERIKGLLNTKQKEYFTLDNKVALKDVKLSFNGNKVINIDNLEITPRSKVLIFGENGTGKTTLLNILSGYLSPDSGKILRPKNVVSITMPIELPEIPINELIKDEELIKRLGLENLKEKLPSSLSAGEKQRVAIGIALENNADVYIFDVPLANIDEQSKEKIIKLIFEKLTSKTLIMVLHGEKELHSLFDKKIKL
ncbi:ABC transporter ATP-binding protein [Thermosipho ferrireducens]|uniref:ABC transporter ATP-binding protein n=1 Tax=Thermosipho ferrireducens TaxID=2571116 RepID=A0ABX7S7K7_9BACT|nr:ABC transporter ATP-binding protein [Thermosipho ferrireducens]QTA38204.1 ABC transporter ATP-binding protein [Thermosipho ferrireducens]